MRESMLDVLMYLFKNYMGGEGESEADQDVLKTELQEAGFPGSEIDKAFQWLEELADAQPEPLLARRSDASFRVYVDSEMARLDTAARGFLMSLEQSGILDPTTRELVIERVMALDTREVTLEQLKWLTLIVLFNQPDREVACARLEDLMFEDGAIRLH